MHPWAQILLVLSAVAVAAVLVPTILALRRVALRTEQILGIVEADLRPLLGRVQDLVDELRALGQDAREEVARVGALTARAEELSAGLGRVVSGVAGLTRAGQLVGIAAGLKTGVDVFLHRLRRHQGGNHD